MRVEFHTIVSHSLNKRGRNEILLNAIPGQLRIDILYYVTIRLRSSLKDHRGENDFRFHLVAIITRVW